ncbi:MAG: phospholipid carrier-dependent glycosyltransferase [Actinobacteria bacterium]|nr:phospholipid carrier-dependent glycosyltransferase [Actinomycetota bacterium]
MTNSAVRQPKRWIILGQYALVMGTAAVLMLWNLGAKTISGHEAFVAVTARTMANPNQWLDPDTAEGPVPPNTTLNHWLVPVFNGLPRLVKTPLAYWSLAGLLTTGFPLNDFTARLPSALAAIGLVALTLALGRRMFSSRAALMASLMLATSLGLFSWGRNARPDMQMTFWMSAAMTCFYVATQGTARRANLWLLLGWLATGLACLAKEFVPLFLALPVVTYLCWRASAKNHPQQSRSLLATYMIASAVGLVVTVLVMRVPALQWRWLLGWPEVSANILTIVLALGLPAAWYAIRCRGWTELRILLPTALPGAVIVCLMFVLWMLYMGHLFPQAQSILSHQTLERAVGGGGWLKRSAAPLTGYYIWSLAKWTLPWAVFIPGAVVVPFMDRTRKDRKALVFLLLWIFALMLLFSVAVGKHEQYILPVMPALCLLMGYSAEDVFFQHRWTPIRHCRVIMICLAIVFTVVILGTIVAAEIVPRTYRPRLFHMMILADAVSITLWLGVWALMKNRPNLAVAALVVASAIGLGGFATRADLWDTRRSLANFATQAAAIVGKRAPIASWGRLDGEAVYYFKRDIPSAQMRRSRLLRLYGVQEGTRLWERWLESIPWLIGQASDEGELTSYGFRPVLRKATETSFGEYILLRRSTCSSRANRSNQGTSSATLP